MKFEVGQTVRVDNMYGHTHDADNGEEFWLVNQVGTVENNKLGFSPRYGTLVVVRIGENLVQLYESELELARAGITSGQVPENRYVVWVLENGHGELFSLYTTEEKALVAKKNCEDDGLFMQFPYEWEVE